MTDTATRSRRPPPPAPPADLHGGAPVHWLAEAGRIIAARVASGAWELSGFSVDLGPAEGCGYEYVHVNLNRHVPGGRRVAINHSMFIGELNAVPGMLAMRLDTAYVKLGPPIPVARR